MKRLKRLLLTAAAVLLATTPASGQLALKVQSFPPGLEVKPGTAVILTLEGLQEGQQAVWHHGKVEGDLVLDFGSDHRLFAGTKAGPRTFVVQVPSEGADPFVVCTFQYGEEGPGPDPPPPPGPTLLLVIEESDQTSRTPALGNLLDKLRNDADSGWLKQQKHTLLILDKDSNDPAVDKILTPTDVLPVIVLFQDGKELYRGPLPKSIDEVLQLVKDH